MTASAKKPAELTLDERIAMRTAPAWRPEEAGDTLEKVTVVGLQIGTHVEYGNYPKVIYRQQNGEFIAVHAFHQVLNDYLVELKTDIGSVQTLVFLGKQESATRTNSDGNPQKYYNFYVENDGAIVSDKADGFAWLDRDAKK